MEPPDETDPSSLKYICPHCNSKGEDAFHPNRFQEGPDEDGYAGSNSYTEDDNYHKQFCPDCDKLTHDSCSGEHKLLHEAGVWEDYKNNPEISTSQWLTSDPISPTQSNPTRHLWDYGDENKSLAYKVPVCGKDEKVLSHNLHPRVEVLEPVYDELSSKCEDCLNSTKG